MTEDRSLDEFLSSPASKESRDRGEDDTSGGEATTGDQVEKNEPNITEEPDGTVRDAAAEVSDGTAGRGGVGTVDPLLETLTWSPDGGECAGCGELADERWRDGDALVCGDCKAW